MKNGEGVFLLIMLLSTENFKNKNKSEFALKIIVLDTEIVAFAINSITKEIEAFDKVGSIADIGFSQFTFSDVHVIIVDDQFTLIPESIFSEQKAASYLNFSTETIEDCAVIISKNQQLSLNTIWYLKNALKNNIIQYWPGSTFTHLIASKLIKTNENKESNTLFVDSLKGSLSILLFTNQELQIANQFDTNGDEDALYYLLLTLEQSKVKVENIQVILSSTAYFKTKLDKYFNKITITSPNRCDLNITEEDKVICSIV